MVYKENIIYIRKRKKNTTMTNKEWKIKNLRLIWSELLLKKETLLKEIFTIEYKLNQTKEELIRYGVFEENSGMGSNETDMGESDSLDHCFAHNGSTTVHKL